MCCTILVDLNLDGYTVIVFGNMGLMNGFLFFDQNGNYPAVTGLPGCSNITRAIAVGDIKKAGLPGIVATCYDSALFISSRKLLLFM